MTALPFQPPSLGVADDMDTSSDFGRLNGDIELRYDEDDMIQDALSVNEQPNADDIMYDDDEYTLQDGIMEDDVAADSEHLTDAHAAGQDVALQDEEQGFQEHKGVDVVLADDQDSNNIFPNTSHHQAQGNILPPHEIKQPVASITRVSTSETNSEGQNDDLGVPNGNHHDHDGQPAETVPETESGDYTHSGWADDLQIENLDDLDIPAEELVSAPEVDNQSEHEAGAAEYPAEESHSNQLANVEHIDEQHGSERTVPSVIVNYLGQEDSLFPTYQDLDETCWLQDENMTERSILELLEACRDVLGDEISHEQQLELTVPKLGIIVSEETPDASTCTLSHILNIYLTLHHNDGIEHPFPLYVSLKPKPKFSYRWEALCNAVRENKGLSELSIFDETYEDHQYAAEEFAPGPDSSLEQQNPQNSTEHPLEAYPNDEVQEHSEHFQETEQGDLQPSRLSGTEVDATHTKSEREVPEVSPYQEKDQATESTEANTDTQTVSPTLNQDILGDDLIDYDDDGDDDDNAEENEVRNHHSTASSTLRGDSPAEGRPPGEDSDNQIIGDQSVQQDDQGELYSLDDEPAEGHELEEASSALESEQAEQNEPGELGVIGDHATHQEHGRAAYASPTEADQTDRVSDTATYEKVQAEHPEQRYSPVGSNHHDQTSSPAVEYTEEQAFVGVEHDQPFNSEAEDPEGLQLVATEHDQTSFPEAENAGTHEFANIGHEHTLDYEATESEEQSEFLGTEYEANAQNMSVNYEDQGPHGNDDRHDYAAADEEFMLHHNASLDTTEHIEDRAYDLEVFPENFGLDSSVVDPHESSHEKEDELDDFDLDIDNLGDHDHDHAPLLESAEVVRSDGSTKLDQPKPEVKPITYAGNKLPATRRFDEDNDTITYSEDEDENIGPNAQPTPPPESSRPDDSLPSKRPWSQLSDGFVARDDNQEPKRLRSL